MPVSRIVRRNPSDFGLHPVLLRLQGCIEFEKMEFLAPMAVMIYAIGN